MGSAVIVRFTVVADNSSQEIHWSYMEKLHPFRLSNYLRHQLYSGNRVRMFKLSCTRIQEPWARHPYKELRVVQGGDESLQPPLERLLFPTDKLSWAVIICIDRPSVLLIVNCYSSDCKNGKAGERWANAVWMSEEEIWWNGRTAW